MDASWDNQLLTSINDALTPLKEALGSYWMEPSRVHVTLKAKYRSSNLGEPPTSGNLYLEYQIFWPTRFVTIYREWGSDTLKIRG